MKKFKRGTVHLPETHSEKHNVVAIKGETSTAKHERVPAKQPDRQDGRTIHKRGGATKGGQSTGAADCFQAGAATQNGGGSTQGAPSMGVAGLIGDSGSQAEKSAGNGGSIEKMAEKSARNDAERPRARDPITGNLLLREGQPHIGSKLDNRLEQRICEYLGQGMTLVDSCGLCDIDVSTLHRWRERGASEPESRYGTFLRNCEKAELQCKRVWVQRIAGDLDWRAVAWLAARRWPGSFTEYSRQELSGPDGTPLPNSNPFVINVSMGAAPADEKWTVIDHRSAEQLNGHIESPDPFGERPEEPNLATPQASPDEPEALQPLSPYDPLSARGRSGVAKRDRGPRASRDLRMRDGK